MKVYKPFESLFYSIQSLYKLTGIGGSYQAVSGLIATLQWFNATTVIYLLTNTLNFKIRFIYFLVIYFALAISNLIYFKDKKIREIINANKNNSSKKRIVMSICALTYIILSIALIRI